MGMRSRWRAVAGAVILATTAPAGLAGIEQVSVTPGADFRPYRKVLLAPAVVTLDRDWLRDANAAPARAAGRISRDDAKRIVDGTRADFDRAWVEAFRRAGYEIVQAPGEGVLEISARVDDLYLNAPEDGAPGIARSWVERAGEATLVAELRDSRGRTVLASFRERRETARAAQPRLSAPGATAASFARLFADWAQDCVRDLAVLKARSPAAGGSPPR